MASVDPPIRVMAVVEWHPPAYKAGGPVRSVHNLVRLLQGTGKVELEVVTGAYELGSQAPLEGISLNEPTVEDGVKVCRLTKDRWTRKHWRERLHGDHRPDVVYLNSLFSVPFALHPLWEAKRQGIRVVLAPRGMLGAGSLAIKPLKKKAFLWASKALGWFDGLTWHASTHVDKEDIERHFPAGQVRVASNVPLMPLNPPPSASWPDDGPLKLLVLGRIHPIKNVSFALDVLASMALPPQGVEVELVGPAEDEGHLRRLLECSCDRLKVTHLGATNPHALAPIWARNHALLMPSLHENFGHATVEAWAHGRPVLLSDRTPWKGLDALQVGEDLPLDRVQWKQAFERMLERDEAWWKDCYQACLDHHRALCEAEAMIQSNLALFLEGWALPQTP